MTKKNLKTLRKDLAKLLENKELDIDSVLRTASEIGRADPNIVRFSTDAAIVSRLGRELVAKQSTALAELVKNAHDADATKVSLTFRDAFSAGGSLEIADNGHGMDRDDIINGFMRLATDEKLKNPKSPKYQRGRAGEKGIGRFAAERLGHKLTLTTKPPRAKKALRVTFDWDEFTAGRDVSSVGNVIDEIDVGFKNGTVLTIEDLRDGWSDAQVRQVWRYVASLQTPFPLRRVKRDRKKDPGFKTWFYREEGALEEKKTLIDPKEFFKHAIAEIELNIDDQGVAKWALKSKRYGNREIEQVGLDRDIPEALPTARNVRVRVYYYIRTSKFYPWGIFGPLTDILRAQGGIRLYRNGYRVLPYGEPGDDWLSLDYEYRRRSKVLAPIGNNNWLGYVDVTDESGELFQETSSREGLIDNSAYRELVFVVSATLLNAALHIENARETERAEHRARITEKFRKDDFQDAAAKAKTQADKLAASVKPSNKKGRVDPEDAADNLKGTIDALTRGYVQQLEAQADELAMLRILASMGLTIAEFTHEYGARAGAMKNDLETILSLTTIKTSAKRASERLRDHFADVEGFSEYFVTTLRQNISRTVRPVELFAFAEQFVEQMRPLFGDRIESVEVLEPDEPQVLTTSMHPSEWSSILMNFMTNSRKAIGRSETENGRIMIETGFLDDETVYLTFVDNGVGIPEEFNERIFEPFFTTTAAAPTRSKDEDRLLGTGLGLKIVRDIVHGVRGRVEVVPPPKGFTTAIRASVPAATTEELDAIYDD